MRLPRTVVFTIFVLILSVPFLFAEPAVEKKQKKEFQTPEEVIGALYTRVSSEPGTIPDWDKVRELFHKDAIIVLRESMQGVNKYDLEGFIQSFIHFVESANIKENGFTEKILKKKLTVMGDVAQCVALYKAEVTKTKRGNLGVDFYHLIKQDGRWWVSSIINEVPHQGAPIPDEVKISNN